MFDIELRPVLQPEFRKDVLLTDSAELRFRLKKWIDCASLEKPGSRVSRTQLSNRFFCFLT